VVLGRAIGSDVGVGRVQDSGSDAHASTDANGERADTGAAPRCTRVEVRSASSLPEDRDASVMPPTAIAEGDFDQDGKLDVVVLGPNPFGLSLHDDVHLFANRGAPNFDVSDFSSGIYDESSFATGDFDGDGKLDLAIVGIGFGPGLSVLLNRGGSFEKPVLYGYDESNVDSGVGSANRLIASGDLDGDGKLDVAVLNDRTITVLTNRGKGALAVQQTLLLPPPSDRDAPPVSILVVDLEGDGRLDLVVPELTGHITVFVNRGHGAFAEPRYVAIDPVHFCDLSNVAAADFDGDGKVDLAASSSCALLDGGDAGVPSVPPSNVAVLLSKGGGEFSPFGGTRATGCSLRATSTAMAERTSWLSSSWATPGIRRSS